MQIPAFVLALSLLVTASATAGPKQAHSRHVRPVQSFLGKLIADGVRLSPTFAAMVDELERSDVIVHINAVADMKDGLQGSTQLIPAAGQRYVRIDVRTPRPPRELLSTIAHELQHALEIARAPDVRSPDAMRMLYQRIGSHGANAHTYDTADARAAGRRVWQELLSAEQAQDENSIAPTA
jgi:hypothetical protein